MIIHINIFQSKALKNVRKSGFLVWKQTIWQPCVYVDVVFVMFWIRRSEVSNLYKIFLVSTISGQCCVSLFDIFSYLVRKSVCRKMAKAWGRFFCAKNSDYGQKSDKIYGRKNVWFLHFFSTLRP
jgi:hypothetical protein